ncbi:MAG: isocitrate lyase/phosphoenolpyruvate mutase family protein [Alphaproteobacteria bacterium]|nr:isocitrate lyase/phosphoenolpyruvate mutase family protein [Alphaproteobacteria bacterium]
MRTLAEKAAAFRALHDEPGTFIIPNPWDAGTARLLAGLGFKALATTSLGLANIHGRGFVSADEIIENARMIAAATDLPTNGDLENCGADEPEQAATMIGRACEAGLAGGSIEDFTGDQANPIYGFNLAVERVYAAVEAVKKLPVPFVLTARAEQLIHGSTDLDATIRRLQAFEQAGADVLYAPGLRDLEMIRMVVSSVTKPVNVVMTHADPSITAAQLAEAGVKRISIGGSGSRFALNAFMAVAQEMAERGTFTFVGENPPWKDLLDAFAKGKG